MIMHRMHIAALALALTAAGLASQAAVAQKAWRHGMVQAKSDAGFAFMVEKGGFAKKRGVNLETFQFKGDALALKALIAGELDSYEGSPGGPLLAASRGADIKVVGCYWPGLTYVLVTKKDVKSVADLKGKTFAISSPGALPDLFVRAILENLKMSSDDVRFAAMGADTDRFRAVALGVVDAAATSSEFTPMLDKMGLKALVHAHEVAPDYLRFCTYMTGKTIASRADDASSFLAAEIEALRYAMGNRDEVVKLTKKITDAKDDDPRAEYIFDEVNRYNAIDPEMPVPENRLDWMQRLFIKTGNMKTPVDLKKFIDVSVREKALAKAGEARH